jgi:hypothetical protein
MLYHVAIAITVHVQTHHLQLNFDHLHKFEALLLSIWQGVLAAYGQNVGYFSCTMTRLQCSQSGLISHDSILSYAYVYNISLPMVPLPMEESQLNHPV